MRRPQVVGTEKSAMKQVEADRRLALRLQRAEERAAVSERASERSRAIYPGESGGTEPPKMIRSYAHFELFKGPRYLFSQAFLGVSLHP